MKRINCPYLGLADDPTTALGFPSEGNHCHHVRPIAPIKHDYQEQYCLSEAHINCPIYRAVDPRPLPIALASPSFVRTQSKRALTILGIPVVLAGLLALGFLWNLFGTRINLLPAEFVPQTGSDSSGSSDNAGLFNLRLTPTTTPFLPPTSAIQQPILPRDCSLPDGWMTYMVNPTDSLVRLSVVYGASVEELQKANCMDDNTVILPGQVIFVPFVPTATPNLTLALPVNMPTLQVTNTLPPFRTRTPIPTSTPEPPSEPVRTRVPPTIPPTITPPPVNTPPPTATSVPPLPPTSTPAPPTPTVEPTATKKPKPTKEPTATKVPPTLAPTEAAPTVAPTQVPTTPPLPSTPTVAPASLPQSFIKAVEDLGRATQTAGKSRLIEQILSLFI